MSACSPVTASGLTPTVIGCCVNTANQYGAGIPNPPPASGSVTVSTSAGSFSFTWNFNSGNQTGSIECTDSPTLIPCFVINGAIKHAISDCGGTPD